MTSYLWLTSVVWETLLALLLKCKKTLANPDVCQFNYDAGKEQRRSVSVSESRSEGHVLPMVCIRGSRHLKYKSV